MRPWGILALAALLLCVALALFWTSQSIAWIGRRSLPIVIDVFDAETGECIAGAEVVAFEGPMSPIEIRGSAVPITPRLELGDPRKHLTNERGECDFEFPFSAAGTDSAFRRTGYIETSGVWIRVTAPDGRRVLVPLDRQSAKPRSISDNSPIYVSIAVDK